MLTVKPKRCHAPPSAKAGAVIIIPTTAPKNWLAPKRLAPETPTRIGKKTYGAADITLTIPSSPLMAGNIWTTDFGPNRPWETKTLSKAINRPPATRAGMIGTKISDSNLMKAITGLNFWFLAAICFKSSVETSLSPVCLISSS